LAKISWRIAGITTAWYVWELTDQDPTKIAFLSQADVGERRRKYRRNVLALALVA
jgi:hypothetical protein